MLSSEPAPLAVAAASSPILFEYDLFSETHIYTTHTTTAAIKHYSAFGFTCVPQFKFVFLFTSLQNINFFFYFYVIQFLFYFEVKHNKTELLDIVLMVLLLRKIF